jgi:hypothetical protein
MTLCPSSEANSRPSVEETEHVVLEVMLYTRIREVLGSNLGRAISYPG